MIDVHPTAEQLSGFGLGKLDEAQFDLIEGHIAECSRCCEALKVLPDDSFVSLVRQSTSFPGDERGSVTVGQAETAIETESPVPAALRDHPRYKILDKLGHGGMGVVYKAQHRLMERVVALKILNPKLLDRPALVERFRREVKGAARLVHPNIVTAYDADQAGDCHFLVMEFVPGVSLAHLLEEHGPLPIARASELIRQAALGLQYAHEQGMVHRDIKPQNLMVTGPAQTEVKILDFGLARFVSEVVAAEPAGDALLGPGADRLTQISTLMGTPEYIAPEQIRSAASADIRADIYSLGCTFYHLLSGHAPFPHGSVREKTQAHLEMVPKPLSEARPETADLARVVEKMMAKDPAQRFQTPADVADALLAFTNSKEKVKPERKWSRGVLGLVGVAACLVLALLFFGPVWQFTQTMLLIAANKGVVEIETDEDPIEIRIIQASQVAITESVDKHTKRQYELAAIDGEIDAKLANGSRSKVTPFTLARGDRQQFAARSLLAAPAAPAPKTSTIPSPKAPDVDDLKIFQGVWRALRGEIGDRSLPEWEIDGLNIRFTNNKFEINRSSADSKIQWTGAFKLETASKEIILTFDEQRIVGVRSSYRFEGDRLILAFAGLPDFDAMLGDPGGGLRLGPRTDSRNHLKQISLALLNFEDMEKGFPPAALTDPSGKPLLSWRVALLPYVHQPKLHKEFKLDEPWDSPHNKKLIDRMPAVYATPGIKTRSPGMTHYQSYVGPGSVFEPRNDRRGFRFADIGDGATNTLIVVEAAEPVIWTKPEDLVFDPKRPLAKLGVYRDGINVAFCDTSGATLPYSIDDRTLRALITRDGGERVSVPLLRPDSPQGPRLRLEFNRVTAKGSP